LGREILSCRLHPTRERGGLLPHYHCNDYSPASTASASVRRMSASPANCAG
jgi:hypothetical protein